jgi:hypothetical protein
MKPLEMSLIEFLDAVIENSAVDFRISIPLTLRLRDGTIITKTIELTPEELIGVLERRQA